MRLTKKLEDGTYKLNEPVEDERFQDISYEAIQKLGKYEEQFDNPDLLKALTFCCCSEQHYKIKNDQNEVVIYADNKEVARKK